MKKFNEFYNAISQMGFSKSQLKEIYEGNASGLTGKEIKLYTKKEFTAKQMWEIRKGFESKLSAEEVEIYAKPEFNDSQMHQLRILADDILPDDSEKLTKLRFCANPDYSAALMFHIGTGFVNGLTLEQISLYVNPEYTWDQISQIRQGIEQGLSADQVKEYANPAIDWLTMSRMRNDMLEAARTRIVKDDSYVCRE